MPNMSYCRFTNTVDDLRDCYDHLDDEDLSEEEQRARKSLLRVVGMIASDYEDEIEQARR